MICYNSKTSGVIESIVWYTYHLQTFCQKQLTSLPSVLWDFRKQFVWLAGKKPEIKMNLFNTFSSIYVDFVHSQISNDSQKYWISSFIFCTWIVVFYIICRHFIIYVYIRYLNRFLCKKHKGERFILNESRP